MEKYSQFYFEEWCFSVFEYPTKGIIEIVNYELGIKQKYLMYSKKQAISKFKAEF